LDSSPDVISHPIPMPASGQRKKCELVTVVQFPVHSVNFYHTPALSILTSDIYIAILSVCASVTFQYSIEMAYCIVIVYSPHST